MTGDIVFLLIFVILPTALIVSGIWLILFIRREPEARVFERRAPAQRSAAAETERVAAVDAEPGSDVSPLPHIASDDGEPDEGPDEPVPVTSSSSSDDRDDGAGTPAAGYESASDQDAIQEVSPLAADLLYDDAGRDEESAVDDSRLIELLEPADRQLMEERMPGDEQSPDQVEQTEEIPGVASSDLDTREATGLTRDLPELQGADPADEWRPRPAGEKPAEPADTATERRDHGTDQLGGEVQDEESELDDEPDDDDLDADQRQRQPGVRLLPTGEAERRRGRTSGRRVPPLGRLSRRDESSVEGGDGPPDVTTGYGE